MFTKKLKATLSYLQAFVTWVLMAAAVGVVCGLVGGAFAMTVEQATHLRQHTSWLPWIFSWAVAAHIARVRPWKPLLKVITS